MRIFRGRLSPSGWQIVDCVSIQELLICSRFNLERSWTPYVIFYFAPTAAFTFYGILPSAHTCTPSLFSGWALNFILRHHPKSMLKIILTLVTLQGGMLARLPNVSYLTFFSYWSIFCIMPIYSMVWQWTTSNTVRDISTKTAFKLWLQVRNMQNRRLADRLSDVFMYIIPAISVVFAIVRFSFIFAPLVKLVFEL